MPFWWPSGCPIISVLSSRRSVQCRFRPGLRAHPPAGRNRCRTAVRRSDLHVAAGEPGRSPWLLALAFTPDVIRLLAPGFDGEHERFTLAVSLTRITFPYLLLMTLVTLYGGILNAINRFAAPAAAPILLNLSMMVCLGLAYRFPTAAHAAAWGVLISGFLQVLLLAGDLRIGDVLCTFRWPRWDQDVRKFFRALGPAVIGSGSVQLALFADTIIASFLPAGAISALYYADRLNQLPIGVIGIAVGTVLLPEMSRRLATDDEAGAQMAQHRAIEFALLLAIPCVVAFVFFPDLIMRALFVRGAFSTADATAAAATLAAYTLGLVPFVLIRTVIATFLARGDTATPVRAALTAVGVNVALKLLLMGPLAQVGLALATSIGAWINFGLVIWFAVRRGLMAGSLPLARSLFKLSLAGLGLAVLTLWLKHPLLAAFGQWPRFGLEAAAGSLAAIAVLAYAAMIAGLFGRQWRDALRRRARPKAPAAPPV